jgi:hypothetical protein
MITAVLFASGAVAAIIGTWRGWVVAREALAPLVHEGDATRTLIDAGRPVHARMRVRRFARTVVVALGWLVVAMYGLFLVAVASS